jgi:hypothetical protein
MKLKISIFLIATLLGAASCIESWESHYNEFPETVNISVWDAMQTDSEISDFIQILKDFQYDTLFNSDMAYTLFVPTNEALDYFRSENEIDKLLIDYLITPHFVKSVDIKDKRKIQTLGEKFALFSRNGNKIHFDGVPILKESPLYRNGKYFIMEEVTHVKPNLYEYFTDKNTFLTNFIDSQDSIIIDRVNSKPIGFDENGNTVYDTVAIIFNQFYEDFFPFNKEFRNQTATVVFPEEEYYREALSFMAQNMNVPGFVDYRDIPIEWQHDILIPLLLDQGVFENLLEPENFLKEPERDTLKLKNIRGDSIAVFYTPVEKVILSNGYAYNYKNFQVPDSLYMGTTRFEAEWLLRKTGVNRYAWHNWVKVKSDLPFNPVKNFNNRASNDSTINVLFPKGYTGNFSVEFYSRNLFPRKYLMVVNTIMNIGGIYDVYVNDKLVQSFDYYDFLRFGGYNYGVTGIRYNPNGNFNKFDMLVDNITEYGRVKIRFEYKAPSSIASNGLIIDYIDFIPVDK